jgi:hypothetical protein
MTIVREDSTESQRPHLFCDFDGVLVDFERGFHIQYGKRHHEVSEFMMWKTIRENMSHWEQLPAMPGALQLWAYIARHEPTILTGCPSSGMAQAVAGKTIWKDRELGQHVPIITCLSRYKPKYMKAPGDILIDDMEKNTTRWTEAGGVAILHTSAESTIAELKLLGF